MWIVHYGFTWWDAAIQVVYTFVNNNNNSETIITDFDDNEWFNNL